MLTRAQKEKIVEELSEKFKRAKIALFSDFHGVAVFRAQALRRLLKNDNAEYKVSKKTLLDRALERAGIKMKTKELQGEISVTFGYGDEVSPAKILARFRKENETFKLLGGIMGERALTDKDILALAKLPTRDILIAQLLGTLQSPIRGLATVLGGNMRNLVVVLNKIKERKSV